MNERILEKVIEGISDMNLQKHLRFKANNHSYFKIYSNINRVLFWLNTGYLYLSDGSNWNDKEDKSTFNPPQSKSKRFGLCTSFSKSKNVAMWML